MGLEREINELRNIASLYRRRGRHDAALEIMQAVLSMQMSLKGDRSLDVALTMYEMAEVLCDLNRFDEARGIFERAIAIWRDSHPASAEESLFYADGLGRLQQASEDLRGNLSLSSEEDSEAA